MGTKLLPGTFDCYAAALPDEPMFILNARDADAPEAVRHWANLRLARIGRGEKPQEDHEMIDEALRCATEMVAWREEYRMITIHPTKTFEGFVGPRWHYEKPEPLNKSLSTLRRFNSEVVKVNREHLETIARLEAERDSLKTSLAESEERLDVSIAQARVALGENERLKAAAKRPQNTDGPQGGYPFTLYGDADKLDGMIWQIGNRFRLFNHKEHGFCLSENELWNVPREGSRWTGAYPVNHCLLRDILLMAYAAETKDGNGKGCIEPTTMRRIDPVKEILAAHAHETAGLYPQGHADRVREQVREELGLPTLADLFAKAGVVDPLNPPAPFKTWARGAEGAPYAPAEIAIITSDNLIARFRQMRQQDERYAASELKQIISSLGCENLMELGNRPDLFKAAWAALDELWEVKERAEYLDKGPVEDTASLAWADTAAEDFELSQISRLFDIDGNNFRSDDEASRLFTNLAFRVSDVAAELKSVARFFRGE